MEKILITGGAGFIGLHVVRRFVETYPSHHIFNLDAPTYAGNLYNTADITTASNYTFIETDIVDAQLMEDLFTEHQFDKVVHLVAESHFDSSIENPLDFLQTNIIGTLNLISASKKLWKDNWEDKLFYHTSTDKVHGTLGAEGFFTKTTSYDPNSPYSASKASSDHFVCACGETSSMPHMISNRSSNTGPNQFPKKLIPLFIENCIDNKALPVYGDGKYSCDWLFVADHARAIDNLFHRRELKSTYNIGGFNEMQNIDLVKVICQIMDKQLNRTIETAEQLIQYVIDRPGHDLSYAIDAIKISTELGWSPSVTLEEGLEQTIDWCYKTNNS